MQGIFKRTKVPKFEVATPTEKAKKRENTIENNSKGFSPMREKKPKMRKRIKRNNVRNKI